MTYPIYSTFSINIVETSTGESRVEIGGDMRIDWGRRMRKQSLLDCLVFGEDGEVMDANTPNIISLIIPTTD